MSLPDFIIVGAPKAGTTTLHTVLGGSPDVFVSSPKEPHYFSYIEEFLPAWATQSLGEYESLFANQANDRIKGESSTWYLFSETAARNIRKTIPQCKIIILLRNPVDRAYSHWSFQVQNEWEKEPFETALEREFQDNPPTQQWDLRYCATGMYADQIKRYFDEFPREQIFVGIFDDLVEDQAGFCDQARAFLGAREPEGNSESPVVENRTTWSRFPILSRMINNSTIRNLSRACLPRSLFQRLGHRVKSMNQKRPERIDPEVRKKLVEYFRDDVRRLDRMLESKLENRWFGT